MRKQAFFQQAIPKIPPFRADFALYRRYRARSTPIAAGESLRPANLTLFSSCLNLHISSTNREQRRKRMKYCTNCGAPNADENQVCDQCKTSLVPSTPEPIPSRTGTNRKKVLIPLAAAACVIVCFIVLICTHIICLSHDWQDATCLLPQTCSYCGKTEGEPVGHTWKDATCIAPQTCSACGETTGEALEHHWEDATCVTPKTCSSCNTTEGSPLGHNWQDATCTEPQTCKLCGETQGEASGHTGGPWTLSAEPTLVDRGVETLYCSVCNASLESRETEKKDAKVDGTSFNFTDQELIAWVNDFSTASVGSVEMNIFDGTANTSYTIMFSDGEVGAFILSHGNNGVDGNICGIMVYCENTARAGALAALIGEEIDPKFSTNASITKLAANESYTAANMSIMQINLDDNFPVHLLAPFEYIIELLS